MLDHLPENLDYLKPVILKYGAIWNEGDEAIDTYYSEHGRSLPDDLRQAYNIITSMQHWGIFRAYVDAFWDEDDSDGAGLADALLMCMEDLGLPMEA